MSCWTDGLGGGSVRSPTSRAPRIISTVSFIKLSFWTFCVRCLGSAGSGLSFAVGDAVTRQTSQDRLVLLSKQDASDEREVRLGYMGPGRAMCFRFVPPRLWFLLTVAIQVNKCAKQFTKGAKHSLNSFWVFRIDRLGFGIWYKCLRKGHKKGVPWCQWKQVPRVYVRVWRPWGPQFDFFFCSLSDFWEQYRYQTPIWYRFCVYDSENERSRIAYYFSNLRTLRKQSSEITHKSFLKWAKFRPLTW